jgi:hypothetical protein
VATLRVDTGGPVVIRSPRATIHAVGERADDLRRGPGHGLRHARTIDLETIAC